MARGLLGVGCWALIVCFAVVGPVGAVQDAPRHGTATVGSVDAGADVAAASAGPPIEPDSVVLDVSVAANGTAAWRIEFRTRLDDPADVAAFDRFQADLQNGSAAAGNAFYERIRASIAAAEAATGRSMSGSDFAVDTEVRRIPERFGVVAYTFRWDGFAATDGDRIAAGDALAGFFLDENERLLVSWPAGYDLAESRPAPDARREQTVVWRGPTEFGPGEPHLAVTETPGPLVRYVPLVAAAVVLAAVVAAVRSRLGDGVAEALPERALGTDGGGADLRSNEERVVALLERNGGRVKQRTVAEELGWSETKTSYVVRNLREEGRIDSFRLGRENVLSLTDRDGPGGGRT